MTGEQLQHIISQICPECDGVNLNEDRTVCWDCQAEDYTDESENSEVADL